MAREHYNTSEKDGNCQWNCLTSYAGAESKQYRDHQEAQLSFERQPQPVSPIAYATPVRRATVAIPETNRFTTWFNQDPYGRAATSFIQPTTATTHQHRHRSWFNQDPYGASEEPNTRGKSWFSQDPYGRPRQSTSSSFSTVKRSFTSKSRPSISAPTDFRRVTDPLAEPMPARRRSFRPLELSIYVEPSGRLSPLPDFGTDEWELKVAGLSKPPTALLRRETMDNSQLHGEFSVPRKPLSTYSGYNPRREVVSEPFLLSPENGPGPVIDENYAQVELSVSDLGTIDEDRTPTFPASELDDMALAAPQAFSQRSSGHSITAPRTQQPILVRHNRSESGSRSSKGSFRRSKSDAVEEAIKELNTIVEEKRIKAKMESLTSPPLSPTSHVPAIAPAMTVRARSETLSDIGSAFSTSVAAPLPAGPSPHMSTSRMFTRSPLLIHRIVATEAPTASVDSSATALPQIPQQSPVQSPKAHNPLKSNPVRSQPNRKDRLSTWLKRVSNTPAANSPAATMPPTNFYQLSSKDLGHRPIMHVRSSASLDTVTSFSSASSNDATMSTPATTVAPTLSPTSPLEPAPRPSISKTPQSIRRVPKRGLSIDTTLSNGSRTVPPAYHELDPHPLVTMNGEITPSRIGVAC